MSIAPVPAFIEVPTLDKTNEPELTENQLIKILSFFTKSLGIKNIDDEDWVIISDIDEIPNPKNIHFFNPKNKRI